jgi:hypothetical protein
VTQEQNPTAAEDLEVEEAEASSVAGGRSTPSAFDRTASIEEQMFRLESAGYVMESCTKEGTRMVNPATNHSVTVRT